MYFFVVAVPTEVRSFNQYNKTSTTAVTLTWTAPEYPNGHIGYELLYGPKASSMSMKTLSSSETNITISELLPYTSYTFIIKAFNLKSHQSGPSRNVSIRTQPSGKDKLYLINYICFICFHSFVLYNSNSTFLFSNFCSFSFNYRHCLYIFSSLLFLLNFYSVTIIMSF